MSRSDQQADVERLLDRVAHAFTPAEWSGRSLAAGVVVFATVAVVTVVQRVLVAKGSTGWIITGVHALIVAVVVPALVIRAVREWRVVQASTGAPE